ncbi:MAG: cobalamin-binding protein, partial [Proteobacteria bacterium]|nr:cobalamin-binding protein [Pseudomonadota bacterium]
MFLGFDDIVKEAKKLPVVSLAAATAYHEKTSFLTEYVDETLASHPKIHDLTGHNPLQVMYDNHRHHAAFMATVFSIANYELLARTVPWVYRAYSAHSFSFDYFPVELKAWVAAIDKYMATDMTAEIKSVYAWMIKQHENMMYLSQIKKEHKLPVREDWLE